MSNVSHLVSVIIPVFNSSETIEKSIISVINQDYDNVEIIVIDDGSTDNTKDIIDKYKHITYIYQANSGVSAARNHGLRIAKGKYIAFLDSDDIWSDATKLSDQVQLMETNLELSVVCSKGIRLNRQGKEIYKHISGSKLLNYTDMFYFFYINFSTVFIRRDFQNTNNIFFQEYLHNGEDWFFLFELSYYGNILFTDNLWAISSYSDIYKKYSYYLSHEEMHHAFNYLLSKHPEMNIYYNRMLSHTFLIKSIWHKLNNSPIKSRYALIKSLLYDRRRITLSNIFRLIFPEYVIDVVGKILQT